MKIGIIGHGFVGLACETGFQDIAEIKIYDKYKPSESLEDVVDFSDTIFLCVPTPLNEDNSCNLSILDEVVRKISKITKERKIIVIKSTVVPGTIDAYAETYKDHSFFFNPEFLTESNFINDFLEQDRIIIGAPDFLRDKKSLLVINDFYKKFTDTQQIPAKIINTNGKIAEMVKYTTNCFLATKLSFFNDIYDICKLAKIDYDQMIKVFMFDKRIGKSHYKVPGPDGLRGWGKSCFPKDLNALITYAKELGFESLMLDSAWVTNLLARENYDWEDLSQVTGNYKKEE
jgi:UDPglucose 6-dehydrogenase